MAIEIVAVTPENVEQAIACAQKVFKPNDHFSIRQEFMAAAGMEPERSAVRSSVEIHRAAYVMALKDGMPAGFSGYYSHVGHEEDVWLGWTGVGEDFCRLGIGEKVVAQALNAAKFEGVENFRIWTTNESEYDSARKLYARMGFAEEAYNADALPTEGASLVRVFTKALFPEMSQEQAWINNSYKLPDVEKFEMARLNRVAQGKPGHLALVA